MKGRDPDAKVRDRIAVYWLTAIGLVVGLAAFRDAAWLGGIELHTNMEFVATVLAAVVGSMALVRFYSKKDSTFLFIGAGFLGTALLDGYHAVVTSMYFQALMPSDLPSMVPWSWIASRQFLSILMFGSWLAWLSEERLGETGRIKERTVYLIAGAFTLASFLFFALVPLPPAYFTELLISRPEEYGPALFFLMALVGYLRKGWWRDHAFEHWLVLSLIVAVITQAAFMAHSTQLFDFRFDAAHSLKIASYVCVLVGALVSMLSAYRQADQSERAFRTAIANMQEGFALYDASDRLVVFNDEFLRLHAGLGDVIKTGLRFEDLIRISAKRGKIANVAGREDEYIEERLRQHRNPVGAIVRELADGTWYIINEARLPDGGIAATETDITELKEAERALRDREALTRRILEASPVGVLIATKEGKHLFANERALEIQGVTHAELMASNAGDFYADPKLRQKLKDDLYRTGSTPPTPVELVKPDGTHYFVILSSTLTEFEGRKAHLTYLYDISELKKTEQALRESEARTRAIVDNIIDGIITIDERGTILSVNPAAAHMFGYSEGELSGQNVSILTPEPYRSAHDRYLANYLTTGEKKILGQVRELMGRRRSGRQFPVELAVNEVFLSDERLFVGIIRDITQRKEVDRLKGEFVSTVSHELRTPLTSIRGALGLVSGGAASKVSKKAREMIDVAEKNTERLINLVNDILDMEKLESGRMEFDFAARDLTDMVESAIEANHGYADEYGVAFVIRDSVPGIMVRADGDRINQVLSNLLSNAAKFSPEGGEVEVSVVRRDGAARVTVTDRGPGIREEFRDKVFGRFTQADSSDARTVGGTGLGLNISKTIVDKHGGTIGFDTATGRGTTFYFELPLLDEPATRGKSRRAKRSAKEGQNA